MVRLCGPNYLKQNLTVFGWNCNITSYSTLPSLMPTIIEGGQQQLCINWYEPYNSAHV